MNLFYLDEDLDKCAEAHVDKHIVKIPMSDYQFKKYEEYRIEERKTEKMFKTKKEVVDKNDTFGDKTSTYRIFSRMVCDFAMPTPPGRPIPKAFRTNKIVVEIGRAHV